VNARKTSPKPVLSSHSGKSSRICATYHARGLPNDCSVEGDRVPVGWRENYLTAVNIEGDRVGKHLPYGPDERVLSL